MLNSACVLAAKDLRIYFRDPAGLALGFLVPITLVTVFGWLMTYAFGARGGMPKVAIWVVDQDKSLVSEQFIRNLRSSNMLTILPKLNSPAIDAEQLRTKIADGDANHGIVIPSGFGKSTDTDSLEDLVLLRDPGREMEKNVVQFGLLQALMPISDGKLWIQSVRRSFEKQGMKEESIALLNDYFSKANNTIRAFVEQENSSSHGGVEDAPETPAEADSDKNPVDAAMIFGNMLPIKTEEIEPPARPKMVSYQQAQSVSGMSVMMLMFGLTGAGAILLTEKEQGTLRRLVTTPIPKSSILLGKFFYVYVVGLTQMLVVLTYGEWMFRVGLWRDPVTLFCIVFTWIAVASGFGIFIASFSKTSKQAESLSTIVTLGMAALGGCWFPVQTLDMPVPLAVLSKSTMTYWAMESFQGMLWNNLSWQSGKIAFALLVQWIWCLALAMGSVYFFRKNYFHR